MGIETRVMRGPTPEPEVIRAVAAKLAKELAASLRDFGFTAEETASIARIAEKDALEFCLKFRPELLSGVGTDETD